MTLADTERHDHTTFISDVELEVEKPVEENHESAAIELVGSIHKVSNEILYRIFELYLAAGGCGTTYYSLFETA